MCACVCVCGVQARTIVMLRRLYSNMRNIPNGNRLHIVKCVADFLSRQNSSGGSSSNSNANNNTQQHINVLRRNSQMPLTMTKVMLYK